MKNLLVNKINFKKIILILVIGMLILTIIYYQGEFYRKYEAKAYITNPPENIENIIKSINTKINKIELDECRDLSPPYEIQFIKKIYKDELEIVISSENQNLADKVLEQVIRCTKNIISNKIIKNEYNKIQSISKEINYCGTVSGSLNDCLKFYEYKNKNDRDNEFISRNIKIISYGEKQKNNKYIYSILFLIAVIVNIVLYIAKLKKI